MFSYNDKISIKQLQTLLILDIFGTGVIILPSTAVKYANSDGWIVVLLCSIFAVICSFIISSLGEMFPNQSFVDYSSKIVSKPIGILLSLGLICKIIFTISIELRLFGEIVLQVLLPNTPYYIIFISMIILSAYAAGKGMETRARLSEILIIIVAIPLLFVLALAAFDVDFSNLRPTGVTGSTDLFKGAIHAGFAFTGLEFCLLIFPYIRSPKKAKVGIIKAMLFIGLIVLTLTVMTISKFGPENVKHLKWPVLELMYAINIPGSFIERQDAAMLSIWIISVFAIISSGLFFSSIISKDLVKKGKHIYYIVGISIIIFFLALIPSNINQVYDLMEKVYLTFGILYIFVIPTILLIIAKVRKLGDYN